MLFLAVFCGFLVENFREHKIEREREEQYIVSLSEDLVEDTTSFNRMLDNFNLNIAKMDSLKYLLCSDSVSQRSADLYYWGRWASRGQWLTLNDRTIQQMKNSGGFRLIQNEKVSKAIIEYYNKLTFIESVQNIDQQESQEYRKIAINIFNPLTFDNMITTENDIIRPSGNPSLLTNDKQELIRLAGMLSYMKNFRLALATAEKKMKLNAINLISLLKQQYHLE